MSLNSPLSISTTLLGKTIVLTRPLAQAKKLGALIQANGGIAFNFPLIEIATLADYTAFNSRIQTLNQCDWAIFISTNAVENSLPRLIPLLGFIPQRLKFAAIGPSTALALKKFGVNNVLTPQDKFDSESLLALPEMKVMQDKKVIIFRGEGGREILADTLKLRGAKVSFAECYQRINPQKDCLSLEKLAKTQQLDGIVVTSSEAMRHLLHMAKNASWINATPLFVNHSRIAESATKLGLPVKIANAPGDDVMLNLIMNTL